MKITVVICTYNRSDILKDCLASLLPTNQDTSLKGYKVLVIDNNSSDDTREVVRNFSNQSDMFSYYLEEKVGLSHARNAGYQNSTTPWVIYLDDDALAPKDFVSRCISTIQNYDFDMFGGMYFPWYKQSKPKWLDDEFGAKKEVTSNIQQMKKKCVSGGIMAIKKQVLDDLGGFSANFGMKGNKISYGEEGYLQIKLLEAGYNLGFDPDWKILHLVSPSKLTPRWHIKHAYAIARDHSQFEMNDFPKHKNLLILFAKILYYAFNGIIKSGYKFLSLQNYYIQNVLIDTVSPIAQLIGEYKGFKKRLNEKDDSNQATIQ